MLMPPFLSWEYAFHFSLRSHDLYLQGVTVVNYLTSTPFALNTPLIHVASMIDYRVRHSSWTAPMLSAIVTDVGLIVIQFVLTRKKMRKATRAISSTLTSLPRISSSSRDSREHE